MSQLLAGFYHASITFRSPGVPAIYSSGRVAIDHFPSGRQDPGMIWSLLRSLLSAFKTRRSLALENLALRQQLAVLQRSVKRPRLSNVDRGLWVLLRRVWTEWDSVLVIVKPDTVVRWHRAGFRRYWTWKSRRCRPGRPRVAPEVRELIRDISRANPLWGAPRVHGELTKLGITISQAAVSKYMPRPRKPPSQAWRSFLDNHVKDLVCVDFFTLPTATFRILFVFIVLRHDRRRRLSMGNRASLFAAGPRWRLWSVLHPARRRPRHRRGSDGAALALAKSVRRKGDW